MSGTSKKREAPEGYVYDGDHLVEAGLGTYSPVYDVDGRVKGAIFCPYPIPAIEETQESLQAQRRAKRRNRRR